MNQADYKLPIILLSIYLLEFTVCAIAPYDRSVWWAENIPVMLVVGSIILISRGYRFSNTSYLFMSVFILLHTIGGHYTFERVPFRFVSDLFGLERNHFDRVAHFSVGFYAYAIAEYLMVKRLVHTRWIVALLPVFAIASLAAMYEIFEWQYALNSDPSAGIAVLGSQGDVWDAQKDMLADTLGAILVVTLFFIQHKTELKTLRTTR